MANSHFLTRLPVAPNPKQLADKAEMPEPGVRPEWKPESGGESGVASIAASEMAVALLMALAQEPLGKKCWHRVGKKQRSTRYLDDLVRKLVSGNLIAFTIPDKPTSRLQQYRLTEKGTPCGFPQSHLGTADHRALNFQLAAHKFFN